MSTLDRDIQVLNITGNKISRLSDDELSRKNFMNLQKIYLNSNSISSIDRRAFHKLIGVIELDLSDNRIEKLKPDNSETSPMEPIGGSETFLNELKSLRILNLAGNKLSKLNDCAFSALDLLRQLHLSR